MQCTFATTGTTFTTQPIWECLTCPLTDGEVLCASCLHTCHSKCQTRLVSEGSRAYCDCGNRGPSKCQGLKPTPPTPTAIPPRVSSTPSPTPSSSSSSSAAPPSTTATNAAADAARSLGRPRHLASNASDSAQHQRVQSASGSLRRPVEKKNPPTSAVANSLMKGALFSLPGSFTSFSVAAPAPFTTAPTIPSQCTYLTTGATFATQPIYACYTCGLFGDYAVCYYCILRCHSHHKIAFISDNKRGYCDCGSRPARPAAAAKPLTHHNSSSSAAAPSGVNAPPCCAQNPLNYLEAKALSYLCTLAQTGTNFHLQRVFHCRDCGIRDDEICCASCAAVCHAGHAIDDRGEMRAYCDCSSNGLCQTLDIMSVVHARQSNHSSHSTTPSIFNLSRRSSLGAAPQLELTDMSNTNSAVNSARQSRRTSLNGPLNIAHALNSNNDPPPVPGDAPQDDPSESQPTARPLTPPLPRLFSPEPDPTNILEDVLTEKHIQEAASPERRRARAESIAAMAAAKAAAEQQNPTPNGISANPEPTVVATVTDSSAPTATATSESTTSIVEPASADTTTASSLPASEAPPSPRKIRALIDSLPLNPSLHDFLAVLGFETLYLDVFNAHELTEVESLARGINEKELEVLVPKIGHRVKIKSALIALRQKMKANHPSAFTSPAAGVVHATNQTTSALPELSLPPTSSASNTNGTAAAVATGTSSLAAQNRRAAEQSCSIYKAVLQSMIQEGAIRSRDEELLSNLRHQSSLSFSHHQSVLRDLGLDEAAFENLKRVGAEREKKEKPATSVAGNGSASTSHATTGGGLIGDLATHETASPVTSATIVPECCICLSEPSNQVFIPCGHVVCCQKCAEGLIRASKEKTDEQRRGAMVTNSEAAFTYPSQQVFQFDGSSANPDMSPRLLGVNCVKCRAPVEHIYRTFM